MENKLWRITLDTNPEDCNLQCIICEEHSKYSDFKIKLFEKTGAAKRRMPIDWLENIFEQAKQLGVKEIIPSTMGEPLLYEGIELIYELAEKYNIKINLTTNGTFPKKLVEEWADIIIPTTSDIKISWNGASKLTAEQIMKGINFQKNLENLKEFVQYRNEYFEETNYYCRITLQLTFMQHNMHELNDIIKLASEIGIDRIKGHHLWTHFKEIEHLSFENSLESKQSWNEIVKSAFETVEKYRKPNGEKIILENFYLFDIQKPCEVSENLARFETQCPFLEKELWISATGKISPCCAPDLQRDSLGSFGNYPETNISDVLKSETYQNLIKNYKNFDLCKICKMRRKL